MNKKNNLGINNHRIMSVLWKRKSKYNNNIKSQMLGSSMQKLEIMHYQNK